MAGGEGTLLCALKYVGIVVATSGVIGGAVGLVHAYATKSGDDPVARARFLAIAISEGMNTAAFLSLIGAPIAVFLAYRRSRTSKASL